MNKTYWIGGSFLVLAVIVIYGYYGAFDRRNIAENSNADTQIEERLAPVKAELVRYQAEIFSECETKDIMSGCVYILTGRDSVSSSSLIRGAAQATMQAYYKEFAKGQDDQQLTWKLKGELARAAFAAENPSKVRDIDRIDSAIAGNVYLWEFEKRGLSDPDINTNVSFGPCWGVPEGWCLE